MRPTLPVSAFILALSMSPVNAQDGAQIVELGSPFTTSVQLAPGQVFRLTLFGRTSPLSDGNPKVAMGIPLPTGFEGVSVTVRQSGSESSLPLAHLRLSAGSNSCFAIPLAIFNPGNALPCNGAETDNLLVQLPYELRPNAPGAANGPCPGPIDAPSCTFDLNDAVLTIHDGPDHSSDLRIEPVVDRIHILNYCEDRAGPMPVGRLSFYNTEPCGAVIVHADAEYVTPANPAHPGEPLALYAWGLGAPDVPFDILNATPEGGVPITRPFTISFTGVSANSKGSPDYVGLVGGSAGLYQVNFRAPVDIPTEISPCGQDQPFNMALTLPL